MTMTMLIFDSAVKNNYNKFIKNNQSPPFFETSVKMLFWLLMELQVLA